MKLFTREEKRNKELMDLYQKYVGEGMKPQRAVDRAREEMKEKEKR